MSQILYFYFELDVNEKLVNTGLKNINSKAMPVGGRIIVVAAALPIENMVVPINAQINFAGSVYRKDSESETWNKNTNKNTAYQRLLKCPRTLHYSNNVESKPVRDISFIRVNYKKKMEKTLRQIKLAQEKVIENMNMDNDKDEQSKLDAFITKKKADLAEQQIIMDGPDELLFNIVETSNYKEAQINYIEYKIYESIHPFPEVYDVKGSRLDRYCEAKSFRNSEHVDEYEDVMIERTPIFVNYE
jgi:hypothetical protein